MYGYIYITTNKINGKIYIGQHKAVQYDSNYLGSGKALWNSINKYGKENFENHIIEWCSSQNQLNEREKYWIKKYNSTNRKNGYNLAIGGEGFVLYGENNGMFGKKHSEKSKKKMSKSVSLIVSGEKNPMYGKNHTEFTKKKIRETMKKNKTVVGKNNPRYIHEPVLIIKNNKILKKYDSPNETAKAIGYSATKIITNAIKNNKIFHFKIKHKNDWLEGCQIIYEKDFKKG